MSAIPPPPLPTPEAPHDSPQYHLQQAQYLTENVNKLHALGASSSERRHLVCEVLYKRILRIDVGMCAKVTSMLLEMGESDVISMIANEELLKAKVSEAQAVLGSGDGSFPAAAAALSAEKQVVEQPVAATTMTTTTEECKE